MVFNSIEFILFFVVVATLYYIVPKKFTWMLLLVSSYYFYMSWNPKYAILIMFSTLITYLSGLFISKENTTTQSEEKRKKRKKLWVFLSFVTNLSILFFFKYYNFTAESLMSILGKANILISIPLSPLLLPVGISFYTFQALSYTVDVYRNDIKAEKHFGYYALFVSFFPQLVAGPIEKSKNLLPQLKVKHKFDFDTFKSGLILMLWGFIKKIIIADRLAVVVNSVYNSPTEHNGIQLVVATVFFAFQIYCDFSGYTDIAIGCARTMGYDLMTNFKTPYFSKSIGEFWRRWHISLSTWFKEYLYVPLGGNRVGAPRAYLNLMIVFLVSGFWHGANWTFIIWGALHGIYQVIGKLSKKTRKTVYDKLKIKQNTFGFNFVRAAFVFSLVCFAWIFFRANSVSDAFYITKNIFNIHLHDAFNGSLFSLGLDKWNFILAFLSIILLLMIDFIKNRFSIFSFLEKENLGLRWLIYLIALFSLIIFGYYGGIDESQFIYFQF